MECVCIHERELNCGYYFIRFIQISLKRVTEMETFYLMQNANLARAEVTYPDSDFIFGPN